MEVMEIGRWYVFVTEEWGGAHKMEGKVRVLADPLEPLGRRQNCY